VNIKVTQDLLCLQCSCAYIKHSIPAYDVNTVSYNHHVLC